VISNRRDSSRENRRRKKKELTISTVPSLLLLNEKGGKYEKKGKYFIRGPREKGDEADFTRLSYRTLGKTGMEGKI